MVAAAAVLITLFTAGLTSAADTPQTAQSSVNSQLPGIGDIMSVVEKATDKEGEAKDWTTPVKLVIIFTALAILPSVIMMTTSFTRIVIVLSFVRRALGTQTIPPNTAIMGLAIFLTLYTMAPTFTQINESAVQPYLTEQITFPETTEMTTDILKDFMLRQCRKDDISVFMEMSKTPRPEKLTDLGIHVVIPAFVISEFRTAFEIGCLLFIPFLLIDLVIASILLSAGMMLLPPVMISLPFKLILFILVDGWGMLARSLSLSFQ